MRPSPRLRSRRGIARSHPPRSPRRSGRAARRRETASWPWAARARPAGAARTVILNFRREAAASTSRPAPRGRLGPDMPQRDPGLLVAPGAIRHPVGRFQHQAARQLNGALMRPPRAVAAFGRVRSTRLTPAGNPSEASRSDRRTCPPASGRPAGDPAGNPSHVSEYPARNSISANLPEPSVGKPPPWTPGRAMHVRDQRI
jgi:hypothetical protein